MTTSYLPVPISDSTILYLRLLNMLDMAAINGLHCNWLSFVSHLMRTSYLQEPLLHGGGKFTKQDHDFLVQTATELMVFRKREEIYKNIIHGDFARRMKIKYENIIPNYLLYSTLGRADLIRFESYVKEKCKV